MSLDYTTLQALLLAQSIHPELTTECPQFIRSCEAMIRRKVTAFELRATLTEADRDADGVYDLSGQVKKVRAIFGADAPAGLTNVGIANIRVLRADAPVLEYAISGQTIEFRGVPGTDVEFEMVYEGWPDPLVVTATNQLLTDHEDLYVSGSLFYLYNHTQDLELAQSQLSLFTEIASDLNKATAKLRGGGVVRPAYNFGQIRVGSGY